MKKIEAFPKNLLSMLYDSDSFYVVPDFQRPYSWNEEQIEELWEDIYNAFDSNRNREEKEQYFMGSVILLKTKDNISKYEIIDGQQRLVTFTILLALLRDYYWDEDYKRKYQNTIFNSDFGQERIRLMMNPSDRTYFKEKIQKKVVLPDKNKINNKFDYAILYFKEKLDELKKNEGDKVILEFTDFIFENVIFIKIVCEELNDAIMLFQIQNTRGLELSNSDLIHSHILSMAKDEDTKAAINSEWQRILDKFNDIKEVVDIKTMDEILTPYAYYFLGKKPRKSIYEDIINRYKEEKKDPTSAILDIREFFDKFYEISSDNNKILNTLLNYNSWTYWQAILVGSKKEGYPEFYKLAEIMRNFYYLYWIAGYTANKTRDLSIQILSQIVKNKKSIDEIKSLLKNKIKEDNIISQVERKLKENVANEPWIKSVLILLEYNMDDSEKKEYIDPNKTELEHILPEAWEKNNYWKNYWTNEEASKWLNKLGNLTLLNKTKNIKAKNYDFKEKRQIYMGKKGDKQTQFLITRELAEKYDDWTPKEVEKRQKNLEKMLMEILKI
ncbi:MAG: DUF262 domain-containing protein [Thermoplasmata archaeon]